MDQPLEVIADNIDQTMENIDANMDILFTEDTFQDAPETSMLALEEGFVEELGFLDHSVILPALTSESTPASEASTSADPRAALESSPTAVKSYLMAAYREEKNPDGTTKFYCNKEGCSFEFKSLGKSCQNVKNHLIKRHDKVFDKEMNFGITLKTPVAKDAKGVFHEALATWMAKKSIPTSMVEDKDFR